MLNSTNATKIQPFPVKRPYRGTIIIITYLFLGLSSTSLHALSKLTSNTDYVDDIIGVIQSVISQFGNKTDNSTDSIEVGVSVRLWRVPGCHELLASLGFDLMDVGQDKVTLRTGKSANRRNIQFVLQALLALFGK